MTSLFATLMLSGFAIDRSSPATPQADGGVAGQTWHSVRGSALGNDGSRTKYLVTPAKVIALAFVGGPDPYGTPRILDVLRRHRIEATFFLQGSSANEWPDLARRILADGHQLGAYTFNGAALGAMPGWESTIQLRLTQAAITSATGLQVKLFYPPLSSTRTAVTDQTLTAIHRATADNYIAVLADRDTRDWAGAGVDAIVRAAQPAPGEGAVVLLHDAGKNQAATVAALDRLIPSLTERGYRFTTVSAGFGLVGTDVPAAPTDRLRGLALRWGQRIGDGSLAMFQWLLIVATVLAAAQLVVQVGTVVVHLRRTRRSQRADGGRPPVMAPVTVLVPAFNEAVGIEAAVRSLVATTHPSVEVIVVDDGSTDDTADIVEGLGLPSVRLIRQANGGKHAALTTGIKHASCPVIVMADGDTIFEPDTITRLVQPFADPEVGAVSGNTKVGNRSGMLGRWQHMEYVVGFNLERRLFDVARCMPTVPGAIGAFRRDILVEAGGVSGDTLAEDTDLTMAVGRAGWRVAYEPSAIAWTEVPQSMGQLWRQRYRWTYGTSQAIWKHRRAFIEPGASGRLGRRGLMYLLLFRYLLPLASPMVDILLVYSLIFNGSEVLSPGLLTALAAQFLSATWSLWLDGERIRSVWVLPFQFVVYRQLMYLVVIQSLVTAMVGTRLRWQRLDRSGLSVQLMERPH